MDVIWTFLLLVGAGLLPYALAGFTIEDETNLRTDKLAGYAVDVRPSAQTIIEMSFQLTALSSVDLRNQQFKVAGWWSMHWTDSRLAWTRADYNDIPVIQIFEDKIWTPTIVVDNSIEDLGAIDEDTIPLRVDNEGTVNWNPPGLIEVNCDMDITHFPFDTQICAIQITSFGYTIQELDVYTYCDGVNLNYYGGDGEWSLLNTWNERSTYTEGLYEYARVYYYFKIQRKPLYYGLNFVLPVIITAVLTVFVFLLPAESGEKIGYGLTVLLAFMVILTLIAADLPTTATNTSLLELYIAVVLIMGALSVALSIYVVELYHRPEDMPIPGYVQNLTLLGMRVNCYKGSGWCFRKRVEPEAGLYATGQANGRPYFSGHHGFNTGSSGKHSNGQQNGGVGGHPLPKPEVKRQNTVIAQSALEDASGDGGEITWQTVSNVLDGFLLRFYTLFLTVSSIVFISLLVSG